LKLSRRLNVLKFSWAISRIKVELKANVSEISASITTAIHHIDPDNEDPGNL
jgi:hypothetical protein